MKYTFEVTCHDIENVIKVEVGFGSAANTVSRTITFAAGNDDYVQDLDELLADMVDNIRLTVKEREEAIYNTNVFKNYIKNFTNKKDDEPKQQIIVENGDPSVLGDPDKYIK